jgi:membrane fusion protein (multidrug efflux system)
MLNTAAAVRPLLALLCLAACAREQQQARRTSGPVLVEVAAPRPQDVEVTLRYPVELTAAAKVAVAPVSVSGFLTRVLVDVGDRVRAGQLVAEIDCREYSAQRSQIEHSIERSKAQLAAAEVTLGRLKGLDDKKLLAAADLDQARLQRDVLQAQLADADARLREATQRLGYCKFKAPFDGWVSERLLDPGEMVRPGGRPVVALVQTRSVRVLIPLLEDDVRKLRPDAEVEVTLQGLPDEPIRGRVSRIGRTLDPATRTQAIEVDVPNLAGALLPGMTGRASIIIERRKGALLLPVTAVLILEEGAYVFVARDGHARRVRVELGVDLGDWLEVRTGIAPTDAVIVTGRELVSDGTPIEAAKSREGAPVAAEPPRRRATGSPAP